MTDALQQEPWIRAAVFCAVSVVLIVVEARRPRGPRRERMQMRHNLGLLVVNTVAVRLVSATSLAGFAGIAAANGWGLLHRFDVAPWMELIAAVVVLDFSMYVQHRLYHWVPWLWRLHAVHHSDTYFDMTTGVRFHVGEILVSFFVKVAVVLALGPSVWAVIAFEALLSAASLFTHSNIRLSPAIDRVLRTILVTPDAHRIHHSTERDEHDRNFGFFLVCWDRWLATYRASPNVEYSTMRIGLCKYRSPHEQTFPSLLKQPFASASRAEH